MHRTPTLSNAHVSYEYLYSFIYKRSVVHTACLMRHFSACTLVSVRTNTCPSYPFSEGLASELRIRKPYTYDVSGKSDGVVVLVGKERSYRTCGDKERCLQRFVSINCAEEQYFVEVVGV